MAVSFPTLPVTRDWVDVTILNSALASKALTCQNRGSNDIFIYFGGTAVPGKFDGVELTPGQTVLGTSDHIWVKGVGAVAFLQND